MWAHNSFLWDKDEHKKERILDEKIKRKKFSSTFFYKVSWRKRKKNFPTNTKYFPEIKTSPWGCMKMNKKNKHKNIHSISEQTICDRRETIHMRAFSSKHKAELHASYKKKLTLFTLTLNTHALIVEEFFLSHSLSLFLFKNKNKKLALCMHFLRAHGC